MKIPSKFKRSAFFQNLILTGIIVGVFLFLNFENYFIPIAPLVCLVLACFGAIYLWFDYLLMKKDEIISSKNESLFLDDRELGNSDTDEDKLGLKKDAIKFAKDVLNNGSNNPIVFGLDAPWGSGKSSYLHLCRKYVWNKRNDLVVFNFRPALYNCKKQDLFRIFAADLLQELKKAGVDVRLLESYVSSYIQLLKGLNAFGLSISFNSIFSNYSGESLLRKIQDDLKSLDKKVIIIIDDLDRLYLEDVKEMIGIVRNIFYVPNITFILCYDTSSINSFETQHRLAHRRSYKASEGNVGDLTEYSLTYDELDNQKVNAYLEKVVQVKKTLLLKREALEKFFVDSLERQVDKRYTEDFDKLKQAIGHFFHEDNYPFYEKYLGDIRKIKRIHNVFVERNILNTNYRSLDPNLIQYLQLILLYINFPHIFRKIYTHESNGVGGFFSAIRKEYEANRPDGVLDYQNSKEYIEFVKTLNKNERELVEELFGIKEKTEDLVKKERDDEKGFTTSSLIFNGPWPYPKNLKEALALIVEKQEPLHNSQYVFHLENIKLLNQKSVEEIFSLADYSPSYGEKPRETFLRTVMGKLKDNSIISFEAFEKVISYMINNLPKYSLVNDFSGVYNGIRSTLVYFIIHYLESKGWQDESGESHRNTEENILPIAERIFGTGSFVGNGILEKLLAKERRVLGLHDASVFITSCSRDSSETIFNLYRALELYGKNNNLEPSRVLHQKLFEKFRELYIDERVNFIKEVYELPNSALLGEFEDAIRNDFEKRGEDVEAEIGKIKNSVIGHLIYQLASLKERAAGHRAIAGEDDNGEIAKMVRDYLFDVCFNVDSDISNAKYFIDYLLGQYIHSYESSKTYWVPSKDEFVAELGEEELKNYWEKNREKIKEFGSAQDPNSTVWTYNYRATYQMDLEDTFLELDNLLSGNKSS